MNLSCPKCGAKNPEEEHFCVNCGASLRIAQAPAPSAQSQSSTSNANPNRIFHILLLAIIAAGAIALAYIFLTAPLPRATEADIRAGKPVVCTTSRTFTSEIGTATLQMEVKMRYPHYLMRLYADFSGTDFREKLAAQGTPQGMFSDIYEVVSTFAPNGRGYLHSPTEYGDYWWEAADPQFGTGGEPEYIATPDNVLADLLSNESQMDCRLLGSIPDSDFYPPAGAPVRPYDFDEMERLSEEGLFPRSPLPA